MCSWERKEEGEEEEEEEREGGRLIERRLGQLGPESGC